MPQYRWKSPTEWMIWKIEQKRNDARWLKMALLDILTAVDDDEIQDRHQSVMASDGYFVPKGE